MVEHSDFLFSIITTSDFYSKNTPQILPLIIIGNLDNHHLNSPIQNCKFYYKTTKFTAHTQQRRSQNSNMKTKYKEKTFSVADLVSDFYILHHWYSLIFSIYREPSDFTLDHHWHPGNHHLLKTIKKSVLTGT
jgi:hypothetical protein